jgi:G3E family GTPase
LKLILVGGFLGSGKTTFIRSLADFLVRRRQQRVVILENEIGEVGIDNQYLAMEGFQVRELTAGCICCTLSGELTVAVNEIGEQFKPDWLVVEATGIARPDKIRSTLETYAGGIDALMTIVLVDAGRWQELTTVMPDLLLGQVGAADRVLVNKIDEAEPGDLPAILQSVKDANSAAPVFMVKALDGIDDSLLGELCSDVSHAGNV